LQNLIPLDWTLERAPPPFEGNDIKFPENFVRHVLNTYTKKKDIILDPFAGMGTTLFVAEEMGRVPFGFETDPRKHEWVAGQLENWTHMIHDDAARLDKYNLPKIDLVLTSPPYMPRHHQYNPLYGGDPAKAGYDRYLKRLGFIFKKVKDVMKARTPLILQLDNLKHGKIFTPLISDIAHLMQKDFVQTDQVTIVWNNAKPDYPMTQYLVFMKR
jgi:DNA modification methylase